MGCDIHFYVERRVDGRWVSADTWTPNKFYTPGEDDGERPFEIAHENYFYKDRNYALFAVLAGVRNRTNVTPIAEPRGLPDDVSDEVRAESEAYTGDGHSHSWLTVAELDAHDWTRKITFQGCVDAENYTLWKGGLRPRQYSQGVGGAVVSLATHSSMDDAIRYGFAEHTFTIVSWEESTDEATRHFRETTMPRLRALGAPEDVRIVFWFDN